MPRDDVAGRICVPHERIAATLAGSSAGITVKLRLLEQLQDGTGGIKAELLSGALADVERLAVAATQPLHRDGSWGVARRATGCMDQEGDAGREWIPLGDFARRLGIARASVYGRIKRGTLEAKPLNKGGYLVQWPPPTHDGRGDVGSDTARRSPDAAGDIGGNGSATVVGDMA